MNYYYEDFTEDNYRRLLRIAKQNYTFINVKDYRLNHPGKVIINRHDLDGSVHRAAKLSVIEKEEDAVSAYFVYLHSSLYNAFEKDIVELLKEIAKNGHEIGLHYEPWFYGIDKSMQDEFEHYLLYEKQILETLLDIEISAVSFHNPDRGGWSAYEPETACGLILMYSDYFRENYGYCSDSDGHWRYRRLEDVFLKAEERKLQVLTHPEWWTPDVLKPRQRILRCTEGRMESAMRFHDENMLAMGRVNEK
jgi:hypothetical protein